jgi:hypothetical protein
MAALGTCLEKGVGLTRLFPEQELPSSRTKSFNTYGHVAFIYPEDGGNKRL